MKDFTERLTPKLAVAASVLAMASMPGCRFDKPNAAENAIECTVPADGSTPFCSDGLFCIVAESECESCAQGFYMNPDANGNPGGRVELCETTCPDGFYESDTTPQGNPFPICLKCDVTCQTCNGGGADFCLTCFDDRFEQDTRCVIECDPGFYGDTDERVCIACTPPCATCTGEGTEPGVCQSCLAPDFLADSPEGSSCVADCPDGSYGDTNDNVCLVCADPCATCTGEGTEPGVCQSCLAPDFLADSPEGSSCVAACPDGSYGDTDERVCIGCTSPCATCTGEGTEPGVCQSCLAPDFLADSPEGSSCVAACPAGFYGDTDERVCIGCTSPCATCTGPGPDVCQSCDEDFFLAGSSCVESCPINTIQPTNGDRVCIECDGDKVVKTEVPEGDNFQPGWCSETQGNSGRQIDISQQTRLDGNDGALNVAAIVAAPTASDDWTRAQVLCSVLCSIYARDNKVTGCELIADENPNAGCYAHYLNVQGTGSNGNQVNRHVCWIGTFGRVCGTKPCDKEEAIQTSRSSSDFDKVAVVLSDDNGVCLAPCPAEYIDIGCSTTTAETTSTTTTETTAPRIS